jgi:uncharacterized phage protein (TIGR02216 family)
MAVAFGLLRLEPRSFWSMTLKELEAALRFLGAGSNAICEPPSRGDVAKLMQCYPDEVQP